MVLDIDEVGAIFNILNTQLARKNGRRYLVRRSKTGETRQAALLLLAIALRGFAFYVHQRSSEALMAHIVNGDAPSEGISPAALGAIGRSLDIKNVRHELMGHANDAIRPSPVLHQTVLRLLSGDLREPLVKPIACETGLGMCECHMDFIDAVIETVKIVTVPDV